MGLDLISLYVYRKNLNILLLKNIKSYRLDIKHETSSDRCLPIQVCSNESPGVKIGPDPGDHLFSLYVHTLELLFSLSIISTSHVLHMHFFFFLSFTLLQRHPSHSDEMCSLPEGLKVHVEFLLQWYTCTISDTNMNFVISV
jgi:hypothetical protein